MSSFTHRPFASPRPSVQEPTTTNNRGVSGKRPLLGILLLVTSLHAGPVGAAAGDLDCAFGTGGLSTVTAGASGGIVDFVVDPTTEALLWFRQSGSGGTIYVGRTLADGTLDTSFGTNGIVTHTFGQTAFLSKMVRQTNGKLVAVGRIDGATPAETDALVVRFNADGSLDATFDGDGILTFDFDGPTALFGAARPVSMGRDLLIQPDGKIVVVGQSTTASQGNQFRLMGVARLTATGVFDPDFDGDGKRLLDIGNPATSSSREITALRVALDNTGKILVGGERNRSNIDTIVFRLLNDGAGGVVDGTPDTAFDSDGWVGYDLATLSGATNTNPPDQIRSILPLSDGSMILVTIASTDLGTQQVVLMAKLTSLGALDPTFDGDEVNDNNGIVRFPFVANRQHSVGESFAVAGGKLIVSGFVSVPNPGGGFRFAHARVNGDGSLDTTYGTGGRVIGSTNFSSSSAAAITADNQVVLGGFSTPNGLFAKYLAGDELRNTATIITSDLPDPSLPGQAVTVNVRGDGFASRGNFPSFTGTFAVSRGSDSCNATVLDGGGNADGTGSCMLTLNTAGNDPIIATYLPDNGDYCSSTTSAAHVVNQIATTTAITSDTPDPSTPSEAVTVNFTVTPAIAGGGPITGTVTVSDGPNSCMADASVGSCQVTLTTLGARTLTATYAGNTNHSGSVSTGTAHQVQRGPPTTTITAESADPTVFGEPFTVSFSVIAATRSAAVAPPTPTGSVTVSDSVESCTGALSSGIGSCSLSLTTLGARTLTANYGGDSNYPSSQSSGVAHTVTKADTVTTITADSPDPSPINSAVSVNWNTTVTAPGNGTPTGNVTVTVSGGSETCSAPVASGNCSINLAALGMRTLTATYAGDASFEGSFDTVVRGASTTTITADTPDPSVATESVLVAVMVTSISGTPTGSVVINDGLGTDCTAILTGGSGSCSLVPPNTGLLTLTAAYNGDANVESSTDTESHAVNSAGTTLDLFLLTLGDLLPRNPVDFGFDLIIETRGGPIPSGNVTVTAEDGPTCTAPVATASCRLEFLQDGSFTVRAEYEGDGNFDPAFSEALIVVVTPITAIPMPHTAWILGFLLVGLALMKIHRT